MNITPIVAAGAAAAAIVGASTVAAEVNQAPQSCVLSANSTNCQTAGDVRTKGSIPAVPANFSGYVLGLQLSS
ncbi:hypothetical protein [Mycobacterium sp.]|jgi:hypothetical protein|uniref:hypothetical protein n=1 Tax=Mycobacterium sp. TaxID=1785 RepID=UPI002D36B2F2|nr:hypothetical protein [Mycobacterium sp.]HZA08583.1 hypothetical protein [Mycobacterium sp.]